MCSLTHCRGSLIYRQERIPVHDVQFRATILVMQYLAKRYTYSSLHRHTEKIGKALRNLEKKLHKNG